MKFFLYIVAGFLLLGPLIAWTYVVAMGCAFKTISSNCDVQLHDYLDGEFLTLAAWPWVLGLVCLVAAVRRR